MLLWRRKREVTTDMYRIGICDDAENVCAEIENRILSYAKASGLQAEVLVWYSGESLCEYLQQEKDVDILFLDIELLSLTGIDVGGYIRNTLDNRRMQIVYISSHAAYAQQLFKTQPLDFLVKPISEADLIAVLELGIKILRRKNEKFQYHYGKEFYQISYGDILYFFSTGRKISIATTNGKKNFYGKLKEIKKGLPPEFIAIHQSYVVNKDFISRYTYENVEMVDGTEFTISQAYRKQVRESILKENGL